MLQQPFQCHHGYNGKWRRPALAPKNFFAIAQPDGGIQLTWDDQANNELNYELYRTTTSGQQYTLVAMIGPKNASNNPQTYIDTGLPENTTFYYRLRAVNAKGGSDYTNEVSATTFVDQQAPSIPVLTVGTVTPSSIQLNWPASTDNVGAVGYDIYKNGSFFITSVGNNYNVQGLTQNGLYTFYVKAKDAAGNISNPSNVVTAVAQDVGLAFSYYTLNNVSNLTSVNQIESGQFKYSGRTPNFDISLRDQEDYFGFVFTGKLRITTAGNYTFYTSSDDGSQLYLNNTLRVDNDGLHGSREKASSVINLAAGSYSIKVLMFEKGGGQSLTVKWEGPGITKQTIPDDVLDGTGDLPARPMPRLIWWQLLRRLTK